MSDNSTWQDIQQHLAINEYCKYYMLIQACPTIKLNYKFLTMDKTFSYAQHMSTSPVLQQSAWVSHENTPIRQNYVPHQIQLPLLQEQPSEVKDETTSEEPGKDNDTNDENF
jgi:hypothetical protein